MNGRKGVDSVKQPFDQQYVQVKVSVKPETAAAFKAACAASDVSMASVLSQFMESYSGAVMEKSKGGYAPDLSDRRKRRIATRHLIKQLLRLRDNEECYFENIPENFHGSEGYDRAEQCITLITEAIELLEEAY